MRTSVDGTRRAELRKGVRLVDVVTLGAGASIGVAIFSVLTPAAEVAGAGLLLALAIAAVPMAVFAVTYAFMASAAPVSGASFAWPSRFVHPYLGFIIAWLRILGSAGAMAVLALVLVQYLSMIVPLPTRPTMLAVFIVFFLLNLFGVFSAVTAIGSSLNGVFMIFTRYLFAMGRGGVLPRQLGYVHERWHTPHVATVVAFVCCIASLMLPTSLVFLFLAINIPTMLKYLGTCLSATRLLRNHPELHERADFRLSRDAVRRWASAGIVCAVLIVVAGFNADWRPYAVLAAWAAVGTLYWWIRRRGAVAGAVTR